MLEIKLDVSAVDITGSLVHLTMEILEQDEDKFPRGVYCNKNEQIMSKDVPALGISTDDTIYLRGVNTAYDHHVDGVFTTLEIAKNMANRLNRIGATLITNFDWKDDTIVLERRGEFLC